MNAKMLSVILSVGLLLFILDMVRRDKMTFKYAFGWLAMAVTALLFALFDVWVYQLAETLGFVLASNFIFFSVLCGLVFLSLIMTIFLCQQNRRNDRIAQKIGLLEIELNQLKKGLNTDENVRE